VLLELRCEGPGEPPIIGREPSRDEPIADGSAPDIGRFRRFHMVIKHRKSPYLL
jgi:hypothetical protein